MSETKGKKSFALGYSLILHSMITYWLYNGTASAGLNIIVSSFAAKNGIPETSVLSANSIGALVSCFFVLLLGKIIAKKGIRFTTCISALLAGIIGAGGMILSNNIVTYAICTIFSQSLCYGYSFTATNALITNWWPRKKGIVMGITTTGIMIASLTLVRWMSTVSVNYGFDAMMLMIMGIFIVFAAISFFWIKERPEDVGLHPDNIPLSEEEKKAAYFMKQSQAESEKRWPIKELARNKTAWLIAVSFGFLVMFTSGVASTTVPFGIESGFTPPQAVNFMSLTAIPGVIGSLITGAIDTKWGPKISSLCCSIWITISFFSLLVFKGTVGAIVCVTMANVTMGSVANLAPSLIGTCFGRDNFTQCYRIIYTVTYFIRSLCFLLIGTGVAVLGTYRIVYIIFGGLAFISTICIILIRDKVVQQPKALAE